MAFPISQKEGGVSKTRRERFTAWCHKNLWHSVVVHPQISTVSVDRSVTLFSGTSVPVSVQNTEQQQRDFLQQDQHLSGQIVVKCITDTAGYLKQTPLKGT